MLDAHHPDLHTSGRGAPGPPPLGPMDERLAEAVCDAVFCYQLQRLRAEAPQPPHYYVARQERDPNEAVLGRLRALGCAVQPLSQCRVTAREGVVDRTTGARGVIVQVARLTWLHAAAVDVVGGYYITHRHAAGMRYCVEHDGRRWVVTITALLWRV